MLRPILLALVFVSVAFGQPAPTKIGEHQIGETLQQWIAISHELDSLDEICHTRKHGVEGKLDKENCKRLENFRDGKLNEIGTAEAYRQYVWHFDGGKLEQVRVDAPDPMAPLSGREAISVKQELELLTRAYGTPARTTSVPYHNAYGMEWSCSQTYWTMADGTKIEAIESISDHDEDRRVLTVLILSKEAAERREKAEREPANPYKK